MSPNPEVHSSHILPKALQCRSGWWSLFAAPRLEPFDGREKISPVVQLLTEPLIKEGGLQEIALSSNSASVHRCHTYTADKLVKDVSFGGIYAFRYDV